MMLQDKVVELLREVAITTNVPLREPLRGETVLLESGLDSIGFAILVTRLEEELGYDPFVLMDEPAYPRTLSDFVAIYERYRPT
jgi:acyl carrier protein